MMYNNLPAIPGKNKEIKKNTWKLKDFFFFFFPNYNSCFKSEIIIITLFPEATEM